MQKERAYAFHQWTVSDVERHFDVDKNKGLSERRANFRLSENGPNTLESLKGANFLSIFLRQFSNFFLWLLAIAAIISYFVDGLFQALILVGIVVANILLGFFQEYKAENAINDLKRSYQSKTKVLRDGKVENINSSQLTLGDVVILEQGDRVPADLRIFECESLAIDESVFTGESFPVEKNLELFAIDTPLADRRNMAYGSTQISSGRGQGIVVGISEKTEFGKIAGLLRDKKEEKTILEKQIVVLSKIFTTFSLVAVAVVFLLGYVRGMEPLPLLTLSIALFVAAVPESLPTAITFSLALGVSRMARKKAIVRRMAAIETLGTVNVLATDKTGTLTNNDLKVDRVVLFEKNHSQNSTYSSSPARGGINSVRNLDSSLPPSAGSNNNILESKEYSKNSELENQPGISKIFEEAILCSNLNIGSEKIIGDPVEVAMAEKAKSLHQGIILKTKRAERLSLIPFDSKSKFMAVTVLESGQKKIIAKGTAEKIVTFCRLSLKDKKVILAEAEKLARDGLKVIALASKKIEKVGNSTLSGLEFAGLFGLVDEPTEAVRMAISKVIKSGIRPIMITGDHPETAAFVANKVGLNVLPSEIMLGEELESLSKKDLKVALEQVKIFARVSPEQKLDIVEALQKNGYCVAVTGDGVNDAPALKSAEVGIAMGIKGTDVAREASDIVLLDDKYGTIITAIEHGRKIFDNIKNAVIFLISGNIDELFLIAFAFIFGLPAPLLTLQILWINLVTGSLPALALAFEEPNSSIMSEKPRPKEVNSIKQPVLYALSLALVLFVFGIFLYLWGLNYSVGTARTLVFTYSVFSELIYAFSIRSKERIWQNARSFFANKLLLLVIGFVAILQLILFVDPLRKIFYLTELTGNQWSILSAFFVLTFVMAEIIRALFDRKNIVRGTK